MRLLVFLTEAYGGVGGIAQVTRDLLAALALDPRVTQVVALPRRVDGALGPLPGKLRYDAVAARGSWPYLARASAAMRRDRPFDLVLSTHLNLMPLAAAAAAIAGAPAMLLLHGIEAWTPPRRWLTRWCAGRADRFVGVSELTLARFRQWAPAAAEHCRVLPCAVDLARFCPGPPSDAVIAKYRLAGTRPLLTLARLAAAERYKGVDRLLEAMPALLAAAPDLVYVIAGAGDDRPRLEAKAAALGIGDSVRFTGYVDEAEKLDLYRAAQAFILAGYGEGFGIVLLEAMACGVPVIASTRDGSYEAVQGGRLGLAVDPDDRAALIAAVLAALRRPRGVRPAGLTDFSVAAFTGRVHQLIGELAGPAARAEPGTSYASRRHHAADPHL
ncbi:MAG TPA: glycosyltransferase family 4 protein [Stellaceae bacterium]|nr:glycosyltransferase family 4 protein [Stellaceae bacterium]